ncbi:MAG: hypothetical protein GY820_29990 [Gammaproteobacteria bacterium]|nr:hypothetical protein [Gammaproteobacteria bacterium]
MSSAKTITARTFASGKSASGAVSTTYSFVATKPTISPNGGRYFFTADLPYNGVRNPRLKVTLSTVSPVTIYYTTNGSMPTTSSAKYTGPLYFGGRCVTTTFTLKAKAIANGYTASGVSSAYFRHKIGGVPCK